MRFHQYVNLGSFRRFSYFWEYNSVRGLKIALIMLNWSVLSFNSKITKIEIFSLNANLGSFRRFSYIRVYNSVRGLQIALIMLIWLVLSFNSKITKIENFSQVRFHQNVNLGSFRRFSYFRVYNSVRRFKIALIMLIWLNLSFNSKITKIENISQVRFHQYVNLGSFRCFQQFLSVQQCQRT